MSSRGTLSRGRKNIGGSNRGAAESAKNSPSASVNLSLFDQSESRATPDSAFTSSNPRTISPRSTKFTKLVLNPRGIFINDTNTIVPSAFSHFRTPQPSPGETIDYTTIPGLAGANIWVSLDGRSVGDIVAEYREMRALNLCEEEFATFAKENFLRGDLRSRRVVEDRTWRSERMLQLVCPPKESAHWRIPPLFDSGSGATLGVELDWSWDIRPDCAYWLSLKGFNPKYRFQIQNCTFVRDWITCPYFTIEFKRDGESEDVAVRQVCAAGALALFNRHHLYCEARRTVSLVDDREGVRHYGLTFVGHKFVFWVLNPTCDEAGRWTGCVMTRLFGADCTDEYAVQELADWINEIHRWGLSWYGPGCERDIKSVLNAGGLRTSSVHEAVG
ncbi:hypothetical protein F4677DRAFT_310087 [Hypoxylon crocopeplum]|nr:hypothetical protein F4677DRAFT_310087 [Hypoxylon crocopeplum]